MPQTDHDRSEPTAEMPDLQTPENQGLEIQNEVEALIHQQSMPVVDVILISKDDSCVRAGSAGDPGDDLLVELQCEV